MADCHAPKKASDAMRKFHSFFRILDPSWNPESAVTVTSEPIPHERQCPARNIWVYNDCPVCFYLTESEVDRHEEPKSDKEAMHLVHYMYAAKYQAETIRTRKREMLKLITEQFKQNEANKGPRNLTMAVSDLLWRPDFISFRVHVQILRAEAKDRFGAGEAVQVSALEKFTEGE